jgi:hypothetical protein
MPVKTGWVNPSTAPGGTRVRKKKRLLSRTGGSNGGTGRYQQAPMRGAPAARRKGKRTAPSILGFNRM